MDDVNIVCLFLHACIDSRLFNRQHASMFGLINTWESVMSLMGLIATQSILVQRWEIVYFRDGCRKHHQAMYNRVHCKVCIEKKNVQHEMYRRYRKIALAQNIEGKLRNWARLDASSGQTCVRLELEGPNNKAFHLENAFFLASNLKMLELCAGLFNWIFTFVIIILQC